MFSAMTSPLLMMMMVAIAVAAMAMFASPNLRDALLKVTKALPNGANNVTSDPIDTGVTSTGEQPRDVEFLLTVPALTTAQLGDGATMKYDVLVSANSDMSSPTTLIAAAITQTGAGGAGAAGTTYRFKLPSNAARYVAIKATNSAAGNASTVSLTLEALV